MKYTDPDGRITQHKDLTGKQRLSTELKDCFGASIKEGIFFDVTLRAYDMCGVKFDVDLGSNEVSQTLNKDTEAIDSCGLAVNLDVYNMIDVGISVTKSTTDTDKDKTLGDSIVNAWTNGEIDVKQNFSIGIPNDSKQSDTIGLSKSIEGSVDEDKKISVGIGFGIGASVWINVSEVYDFAKTFLNGDF